MTGSIEQDIFAVRQSIADPFTNTLGRDDILATLQNQRRDLDFRHIRAVVREEGDPRELARNFRIGGAKAVGQCLTELGPIGIAQFVLTALAEFGRAQWKAGPLVKATPSH